MDLYIRGASHKRLYLRAGTTQERQKWLVALGSAKACLLESKEQGERKFFSNYLIMNILIMNIL